MNQQLCTHCHRESQGLVLFEAKLLCAACLSELTCICQRCGIRIDHEDNVGSEEAPLCRSCYGYSYTTCEDCGRELPVDSAYYLEEQDDDPLCQSCYEERLRHKVIQDYYYKPEPLFYGQGPRFFGVELEVDGAGEDAHAAAELQALANREGAHLYCKHDGSLNDGFELVSHPMSLDYHLRCVPWGALLQRAISQGYRSHRTRTCGLHVHVSRTAFGQTETEQEEAIARILYFFEKHWEELLKFSRRTEAQLSRWAARYGYQEYPKEILQRAKKGYGGGRYTCVNLSNAETIEFRIFRGTLKYNTFVATLQLLDKICDVALFASDEELKGLSWTSFVASIQQPELVQYLKARPLSVNDPIMMVEHF